MDLVAIPILGGVDKKLKEEAYGYSVKVAALGAEADALLLFGVCRGSGGGKDFHLSNRNVD